MYADQHRPDHYYYRKTLKGLEKKKIYFHSETKQYFLITRFFDSLDRKSHFVEFYEIEFFPEEAEALESGTLMPIRKGEKRIYCEMVSNFKKNFIRLSTLLRSQAHQESLQYQCSKGSHLC
jgi:hypothetical protein